MVLIGVGDKAMEPELLKVMAFVIGEVKVAVPMKAILVLFVNGIDRLRKTSDEAWAKGLPTG